MKLLALDIGDKRIGVAASELPGFVMPVGVVHRGPGEMEALRRMALERDIERIIVGLPTGREGEIGPQAQRTLEFIERLKNALNLTIETWDESFTTAEAEEMLISAGTSRARRRKAIDATAAVILLRSYLDANPD
jgi:putative holliday junction resolvase